MIVSISDYLRHGIINKLVDLTIATSAYTINICSSVHAYRFLRLHSSLGVCLLQCLFISRSLADGLLTQIHPVTQAIPYAFFYYTNLVMVPGAIAVLAAIDALLPLASQLARRHFDKQHLDQHTGPLLLLPSPPSMSSPPAVLAPSSSSASWSPRSWLGMLSDPVWVAEVRVSLREAVQLVAPWDTSLTAVVAVFFIAPNMGTVTEFMFDATPPCPQVSDATGGITECVIVKATVLDTGGFLLLAWASLLIFLTRSVLKGQQGLSNVVMGGSLKQAASSRPSAMRH